MGINVTRYSLVVVVIGSMLIGFQGAWAAHLSGHRRDAGEQGDE
jgi:ABC-type branched-subunit amino acid transport system permease subunit